MGHRPHSPAQTQDPGTGSSCTSRASFGQSFDPRLYRPVTRRPSPSHPTPPQRTCILAHRSATNNICNHAQSLTKTRTAPVIVNNNIGPEPRVLSQSTPIPPLLKGSPPFPLFVLDLAPAVMPWQLCRAVIPCSFPHLQKYPRGVLVVIDTVNKPINGIDNKC